MSENRYGGWNQDDSQNQNNRINYNQADSEPITESQSSSSSNGNRIERRTSDNARDFFYWFGNNGGFRALPKLIAVIAMIILIIWIIVNRKAIYNGIIGLFTELLPIILLILLLWYSLKNLFNPK